MDRIAQERQLESLREAAQAIRAQIGAYRKSGGNPAELIEEHRRLSKEIERLESLLASPENGPDGSSPPLANTLHPTLVTGDQDFAALNDEWHELLVRTGIQSVFNTWEWLYSWWEVYGRDKKLRLVVVRDDTGVLVGLAPLMLGKRHRGTLKLHRDRLGLIGTGEGPLADTLTLPHDPALHTEVLDAIWQQCIELRHEWSCLELEDLCPVDPSFLLLQELALRRQYMVVAETTRLAVEGELPTAFDTYVDNLKHNRRRKHLRALPRRLAKEFRNVEYLRIDNASDSERYLQELASLSKHRFESKRRSSAWVSPLFADCMHLMINRLQARGIVRLHVLRVDGATAAILLGFAMGNTYQCFQPVFSEAFARYSPLHCLLGYCIEDAIANGLQRFDFLAGEHGYKTEYFDGRRPVGRILIGAQTTRFWQPLAMQLLLRSLKISLKGIFLRDRR